VGGLEVRDKKDPENAGFVVDIVATDPNRYGIKIEYGAESLY